MNALHDETRARWGAQTPEQFIEAVMQGAVCHKLDMSSIVIHVYAQIVHQFPDSAALHVQPLADGGQTPISLRDVFLGMRTAAANAQTTIHNHLSLRRMPYSPEYHILYLTGEIRQFVSRIEHWAHMIIADGTIRVLHLPGAKGKTFGEVAREILEQMAEIRQLLDFAQTYAEQHGGQPSARHDTSA